MIFKLLFKILNLLLNHNYRSDIQELAALEQIPNLLYNKLELLLNEMTEFNAFEDFKIIDSCKLKYTKLVIN